MVNRSAAARFELLREVFDLAREQRHALEDGALGRFEQLLDRRETLIAQLQALTPEPLELSALPENVVPFPSLAATGPDDAIALDTVIRGILEHDRHNEQLLRQRLEAVRAELPQLEAGRRVANGYRLTEQAPRFIDRQS